MFYRSPQVNTFVKINNIAKSLHFQIQKWKSSVLISRWNSCHEMSQRTQCCDKLNIWIIQNILFWKVMASLYVVGIFIMNCNRMLHKVTKTNYLWQRPFLSLILFQAKSELFQITTILLWVDTSLALLAPLKEELTRWQRQRKRKRADQSFLQSHFWLLGMI